MDEKHKIENECDRAFRIGSETGIPDIARVGAIGEYLNNSPSNNHRYL